MKKRPGIVRQAGAGRDEIRVAVTRQDAGSSLDTDAVTRVDQLCAGLRDERDAPFQRPDFPRYADVHACFTLPPFFRTIARSRTGGFCAATGPAGVSGIAPVSTGTRRLPDWSDYT